MGTCEMCGKSTDKLFQTKIVGSLMNVCENCSKVGNVVETKNKTSISKTFYKKKKNDDIEYEIRDDYISIIQSSMSKKNINTHQLARIINIKESTLNKILTNKFKLENNIARKIEDYFKIKLIIEIENSGKSTTMILNEMKNDEVKSENLADLILQKLKEKENK